MNATGGANEDLPRSTIDETALAHQVHEAWEKKAAFWDEAMGEGTDTCGPLFAGKGQEDWPSRPSSPTSAAT